MRIVVVWLVGLSLIATIMMVWYITQPMLLKFFSVTDKVMDDRGWNTTQWEQTYTLLQYFGNLWPVPFVIAVGLWMFISAQNPEAESRVVR